MASGRGKGPDETITSERVRISDRREGKGGTTRDAKNPNDTPLGGGNGETDSNGREGKEGNKTQMTRSEATREGKGREGKAVLGFEGEER